MSIDTSSKFEIWIDNNCYGTIISEALPLTIPSKKLHLFENSIVPQGDKDNICTTFVSGIQDTERINLNRVNTGIFRAGIRYCETTIVDHEATLFLSTVHNFISQCCVVVLPIVDDTAQDIQ